MKARDIWTRQMNADLRRMWAGGKTASEISQILRVTKNAVVGKAHRLGCKPRPSPVKKVLWTAGRIVKLRELWLASLPVAEIAKQLGICERTVYKKTEEMDLPKRASGTPSSINAVPLTKKRNPRSNDRYSDERVRLRAKQESNLIIRGVYGGETGFDPNRLLRQNRFAGVRVRYAICQWIAGEPSADDGCKCGEPTADGSVYCAAHYAQSRRRSKSLDEIVSETRAKAMRAQGRWSNPP